MADVDRSLTVCSLPQDSPQRSSTAALGSQGVGHWSRGTRSDDRKREAACRSDQSFWIFPKCEEEAICQWHARRGIGPKEHRCVPSPPLHRLARVVQVSCSSSEPRLSERRERGKGRVAVRHANPISLLNCPSERGDASRTIGFRGGLRSRARSSLGPLDLLAPLSETRKSNVHVSRAAGNQGGLPTRSGLVFALASETTNVALGGGSSVAHRDLSYFTSPRLSQGQLPRRHRHRHSGSTGRFGRGGGQGKAMSPNVAK